MTTVTAPIVLDEKGVPYIEGTALKVIELVQVWKARSLSPEQLQEEFPQLSLEQVYAALSYYHGHGAELDADIERRRRYAEEMRVRAGEHPFTRRMREAGRLP